MNLRVVFVITLATLVCGGHSFAPAGQLSANAGSPQCGPLCSENGVGTHFSTAEAGPQDQSRHDVVASDPAGDLPVRAVAASYKGTVEHAWVLLAIELDPHSLRLRRSDARYSGHLAVDFRATDAQGQTRSGSLHDGLLTLDEEAYARSMRHGLRVIGWIELPGGQYELRVSVRTARKSGTAVHRLRVPDFDGSLSMSTVSVHVPAAAESLTIAADEAGPVAAPIPAAQRVFERGHALVLFTEVYESAQRLRQGPHLGRPAAPGYRELGDHTIHVVTELQSADGVILRTVAGRRQVDASRPAGRHAFSTFLPLDGIPPGDYRIRVRARANIGPADTAAEEIAISVR